jgi:hypothetical protein
MSTAIEPTTTVPAPAETPNDSSASCGQRHLVELPGERTSITDCARALFTHLASTNRFFRSGDKVLHLERRIDGYHLRPLTPVAALSAFDQHVTFVEILINAGRGLPKIISEQMAKTLLASQEVIRLPEIAAVVPSPMLVKAGDRVVSAQNGYNAETKLFVGSTAVIPELPLDEAVNRILFILREYQFFEDGDKSRAIASILTPALKLGGFIVEPTPIDVAEADESQSGKSYRQRLIPAVYNTAMAVVTNQKGGVGSLDENLAQELANGQIFIQIDNVRGKMNSQRLEGLITADQPMSMRVPHIGHVSIDPSKYSFYISSNNFEPTPDLANRSSIIRIRKRYGFAYSRYGQSDLLTHVRANYVEYLAAVHSVIRHWWERGHPQTNETRHDMRQWCQILDWIVQNLFQLPPLMEGHEEAKSRTTNPYLGFLRTVALIVQGRQRLGAPLTATLLSDLCAEAGEEILGLRRDLQGDSDQRKRRMGTILGTLFSTANEVRVEGFLVQRNDQTENTTAGNRQTIHYYTFLDQTRSN